MGSSSRIAIETLKKKERKFSLLGINVRKKKLYFVFKTVISNNVIWFVICCC